MYHAHYRRSCNLIRFATGSAPPSVGRDVLEKKMKERKKNQLGITNNFRITMLQFHDPLG